VADVLTTSALPQFLQVGAMEESGMVNPRQTMLQRHRASLLGGSRAQLARTSENRGIDVGWHRNLLIRSENR
jgi:hypothetical protein